MAQLTVDIGGSPGINCRGYCEYCYFKKVKGETELGCRYCLPFKKGCDYCTRGVKEEYSGFKDLRSIADETLANLQLKQGEIERITISGGGDPSCYPQFKDLIELLGSTEAPLHIGYTSGKGWDDPAIADLLIENGLTEISFTVFATDPKLRKQYMHDPTPEASLVILEKLCGAADVYAATVVLPGVNDGKVLEETCRWLQDRGAKGLILMRFANATEQGLILGNGPVMGKQNVQSVESFRDMITDLRKKFTMKISGTPLWDPEIGSPFAIRYEPDLLAKLPRVTKRASVISGSIATPFIDTILSACGSVVSVVPVTKEIACLITADDLRGLDLASLETVVIIPGRAFVHDAEAEEILSRDGIERSVIRGPDMLTADAETSMGMTRDQVLEMEMNGFAELIQMVNRYGK
ncbi:MAG: methyl coenzyme M reductase-arginine methyltransferase Mmp10 [Methanoregula sp.]|jgi:methanogenesis marker radical SAM protein|uniref:methyl coenzyme M reductase-arginine methyltransferase Mmp10 n=1 Tax=Methanoregula sp. TaxID=2052170 RepID=UPI0025F49F2B|nr:methyl coenzyme M reductase-arginine methyltransferase Mmp10 [Methanoregula sp.]MCK9630302.1 methyl coenzyme M reductase-arginine methyltransferase Mmp10 [Methanoregula sp.]